MGADNDAERASDKRWKEAIDSLRRWWLTVEEWVNHGIEAALPNLREFSRDSHQIIDFVYDETDIDPLPIWTLAFQLMSHAEDAGDSPLSNPVPFTEVEQQSVRVSLIVSRLMVLHYRRQRSPNAPPEPDGPDLNLDRCFYNGRPAKLSPLETDLLRYLWPRGSTKVVFLDLATDVWGDAGTPSATIRSSLYRLRKIFLKVGIPWKLKISRSFESVLFTHE